MSDIRKSLQLLQWYYHFLYLWKFLENVIQHNDLSPYAQDIPLATGEKTSFTIKWSTIKTLLTEIHKQPDKKNLFWYMVETNAWRGIFSIMRELLQDKDSFQKFVQLTTGDQYFWFEQIIIFVRNILTHSIDSNRTIDKDGIVRQKSYLMDRNAYNIHFDFHYADYIAAWKGSKTYGINLKLNFKHIRQWQALLDVISVHHMYLLVELCYNLCALYQQSYPTKKIKRK